uniref:MAM and LDL-receptor class A domain-containing protein 1-like n=1 Tax=Phallusia mammillata TaxID=59560 RepID=A0A6F9DK76_9ASCI|nr:MAM and LDL-receptor class A domain-containing protein 1-like [Phallusia mammillata]
MRNGTNELIGRIELVENKADNHKMEIDYLSEQMVQNTDKLEAQKQRTNSIAERVGELERGNNQQISSAGVMAVDEVRQALVKLTGALARRNATAWSLSQRSSSIEFPLEGDYAVYQEVEPASEGVGTEVDFYSLDVATAQANTSLQEFLKETNSNIGHLTSNLITALRAISGSFSADPVGPTMHQEPPRNHGNHDAFGAVILDFSDRLVDVEMLVLSMNASMHLTSQDGGNELDKIVELSQNITDLWTLVDQLQTNGREKETLIHTALQKVDDVRDDVASQGANIFNVLSDIKYFNTTIQELSDTQGVQHYVLGNMLQQQEQHTSDLQRWRRQMDEIGVESSHALSTATNATNKCNKLDTRIDRELSGLQSQIAENRNNLGASLAENFTAIRNGLEEAKNMARSLGEEMRQRFEEKEHPSISEIQLEHIDNQINDFYRRQQDMETSLRESDIRFLSMEDQITEINELIPLLSNDTRQRVQQVVKFLGSEIEEVEKRSLLHLSDLQNTLSTLTATLMSEDQKMANLLNSINATVWVNSEDLAGLTRTTNNLLSQDQNTQLALMRHSTELKGFTRTFRTIEDLIRTVTETVTLNSNQITIITGDLQTSSDRQTTTMDLVTDMLSNHSIEIEHLTNQISALAQDIHNRASVHVVIPNKNPAVSRFSTVKPTTAPPTTVSSTTTTTLPLPTTPLGPVPEPTGLSVISSTATELTMSWLPVEDPSVDEYRVIVQNIHGAHASSEVVTSSPPATIGNLDPGSRYLITLYSSRNGELSKPLNGLGETLFRPSPRPAVPTTTTTLPALPTPSSTPDSNAISVSNDYSNQVNIADMADFYCDFETSGLCNFLDDTSDDFDWMRNNGTTPSSDTGPSRDHTLGSDNGHYMFIEASRPRQPGDKARLVSPLMEPTTGQCLEFYYHMFGVGAGELQVHMQHAGARTRTQVWADIGNHGDQWKRAKTTISSDLPFQIVFEGIRGTDYHSDIAFDDVIIKPGACPKPMLQCGFEDDTLCGFTQDSSDDFDWTQNTGATSSADTGPITDHTLGGAGGHYIYLEASNPRYPGDITRISSPTLNPTNAQCLQFYYHMHGVDIGSLKVYLRQTSQPNDLGIAIWSKHGSQGNDWILGRTSILSTEAFQIVFEGSRGDDYHGDIALDDVVITDGFCDQPVCPVGRKFGDLCYKVEETGRTYQDASAVCKSNGGLLAAVKTQEQQNFLVDMVSGYGNEWTLFWIGLDDKVTEGRFVYSDDMPLAMSDRSFGAWAAGEPNDALGDEDCVNMEYQSKQRRWNDVPCNRENWFICQYPVSM